MWDTDLNVNAILKGSLSSVDQNCLVLLFSLCQRGMWIFRLIGVHNVRSVQSGFSFTSAVVISTQINILQIDVWTYITFSEYIHSCDICFPFHIFTALFFLNKNSMFAINIYFFWFLDLDQNKETEKIKEQKDERLPSTNECNKYAGSEYIVKKLEIKKYKVSTTVHNLFQLNVKPGI